MGDTALPKPGLAPLVNGAHASPMVHARLAQHRTLQATPPAGAVAPRRARNEPGATTDAAAVPILSDRQTVY